MPETLSSQECVPRRSGIAIGIRPTIHFRETETEILTSPNYVVFSTLCLIWPKQDILRYSEATISDVVLKIADLFPVIIRMDSLLQVDLVTRSGAS